MNKYYYKKDTGQKRRIVRVFGLLLCIFGFVYLLYFTFPLIMWKLTLEPVYASQGITTPIPQTTVLNKDSIRSLFTAANNTFRGIDYTDAQNWYPGYHQEKKPVPVDFYSISIPKLHIQDAIVSTVDYDLAKHLVNYGGTAVPPEKGNAVIFGHSTLPQLYNPKDYKTIFANIHKLNVNDMIEVKRDNIVYTYRIISITIVDPDDTSPLTQQYEDSYLTIITCTPPGTIWKRLIIRSKIEKLQ